MSEPRSPLVDVEALRIEARIGRHVLDRRPEALGVVRACLRFYAQIRLMYERTDLWESEPTLTRPA